ncbi:HAMP domain-containing sensor histidine kinase [Halioxenophilus sp. WMMB6]|uniref:sensor histidine kinase n=1 Tax=Halioxenophilus sp. WMMB6 TaxID=3073815 RepID=UPI00295E866C|nr:HAMP domain-containing sensor histidine kinase [Halioxenophilus sp. WMMB6]
MSQAGQSDEFSLILASSVHDMKNSLGMLLSSLEEVVGETKAQNERQAQLFATLQYEASRINGELIQLLSIYRMQKNRMPVAIDEHYVVEVLDDLLARNESLFAMRAVAVDLQCDPELIWYFDSDLITSVVNDALVNCSRYSKDRVQLSAAIVNECLEIRVSDNGNGYPPSMLGVQDAKQEPSVFDQGRTNLGLYFATRVAALHTRGELQGELRLENSGQFGGGEFVLTLP